MFVHVRFLRVSSKQCNIYISAVLCNYQKRKKEKRKKKQEKRKKKKEKGKKKEKKKRKVLGRQVVKPP